MRVAIQGTHGSYSECAARSFFPGCEVELVPRWRYSDVFAAVDTGEAGCMAIPIENTTEGSVYQYYNLLLEYAFDKQFRIVDELKLRIRHALIGNPGAELADIREVRSHYQALGQCREYLRKAELTPVEVADTAGAAQELKEKGWTHVAAIASVQAARDMGLSVLARDIQDRADNYTRFLLVQREVDGRVPDVPVAKCSVVFCIPNVEGSLFRTLAAFATRRGVSLIRLESRPLVGAIPQWTRFAQEHTEGEERGVWDLVYYVDFLAPGVRVPSVIEHLRDLVLEKGGETALQVVGVYPNGRLIDRTGEPWR
ncbi:MAG: bifunctional chorismate mutase/prephenate dehydratase [Acidobacteria bacterium]|nr:bifunctional chorismate mutase/prephenate dehydratase [Acidobacteriota bacterium]